MSNLLEKASIITTPTAYSEGKLHSVKGGIDADFDFTRGSSATRVNSQGLIENVQILSGNLVQNGDFSQTGSELVTNGAFDADSDWTATYNELQSSIIISNNQLSFTSTVAYGFAKQEINVTSGKTYKMLVDIDNFSGSIRMFSESGNDSKIITSTGLIEFYFVPNANTTLIGFSANNDIGASVVVNSISVKEVGQNWSFGTGWSMGDGVVSLNSPTGNLDQSLSTSSGSKYRVTFTISNYVSGDVRWRFTGTSNENGTLRSANGTYTEEITLTNNQSVLRFPSTAGVMDIDNISIIEITDDTNLPRIDYTGGTGHILLEPQSTNVTTNSEQPSTWHSNNNVTITTNATTSPDGTTNSSLVVVNGSSGAVHTRNICSFPSGSGTQTVTLSCFLKYYNNQFVALKSTFFTGSPANNERSFFNIQNGVLGTVGSNHTAKMENYGDGWYRCSITFDIDKDQDTAGYIQVEPMNGDNTSTFAAIGQGFYAFGSQGEELSFMTSYIPVPTNNSVTRSRDEASNAGSSDLINSTEGVLYAEISALADDGTFRVISLDSGDNTNTVKLGYRSTSNAIYYEVRSGNVSQAFQIYTTTDVKQFHKVAVLYQQNNFKLFINGVNVLSDTSGITPVGLNNISFDVNSGAPFYGKVKSVAVFKEALTDAQLTCLTT